MRFLCKEPCHGIEDAERATREKAAAERRRQAQEEEWWQAAVDRYCAYHFGENWESTYGREWGEEQLAEERERRDRERDY